MNDASNESPTSEEGARQQYAPRREELIRWLGAAGDPGTHTIRVRIKIPDARLICKLTLIGSCPGTAPARVGLAGRGLKLWVYAVEQSEARSEWVPVTDLVGTFSANVDLPLNTALGGFSREFVTTGNGVEALINVPIQPAGGVECSLFAQAVFQPKDSIGVLPWSQWDEMRRQCELERLDPLVIIP